MARACGPDQRTQTHADRACRSRRSPRGDVIANSTGTDHERVCALCGASLVDNRPHARFCTAACRVEAHRIRSILSPANPERYRSVRERLEAAQEPYTAAFGLDDVGVQETGDAYAPTS